MPLESVGPTLSPDDLEDLDDAPDVEVEATEDQIIDQATAAQTIAELEGKLDPARFIRIHRATILNLDYLRELHTRFSGLDLAEVDVLLDCANGATYHVAPEIFRRLGAQVTVTADAPDGRNINAGCGSTHVHALAERVVAGGHAVGFAFDGDGDRVLAVDRRGAVVDGDELMAHPPPEHHRQDPDDAHHPGG